jgi:hypothetical protein
MVNRNFAKFYMISRALDIFAATITSYLMEQRMNGAFRAESIIISKNLREIITPLIKEEIEQLRKKII